MMMQSEQRCITPLVFIMTLLFVTSSDVFLTDLTMSVLSSDWLMPFVYEFMSAVACSHYYQVSHLMTRHSVTLCSYITPRHDTCPDL